MFCTLVCEAEADAVEEDPVDDAAVLLPVMDMLEESDPLTVLWVIAPAELIISMLEEGMLVV